MPSSASRPVVAAWSAYVPWRKRGPGRDRRAMPGRQVVEDDDLVAGGEERLDRHRADIAGAAGDQDPRHARNDTRWQRETGGRATDRSVGVGPAARGRLSRGRAVPSYAARVHAQVVSGSCCSGRRWCCRSPGYGVWSSGPYAVVEVPPKSLIGARDDTSPPSCQVQVPSSHPGRVERIERRAGGRVDAVVARRPVAERRVELRVGRLDPRQVRLEAPRRVVASCRSISGLVNRQRLSDGPWRPVRRSGSVPGQSFRYDGPSKSSSSRKQPLISISSESRPGRRRRRRRRACRPARRRSTTAQLKSASSCEAVLEVADLIGVRDVVGVRGPRVAARVAGAVLRMEGVRLHVAGVESGSYRTCPKPFGYRRRHRPVLTGGEVARCRSGARRACRACGSVIRSPGFIIRSLL